MSLWFLNITINFENNGDFLNCEQWRWNYLVENKGEKILWISTALYYYLSKNNLLAFWAEI